MDVNDRKRKSTDNGDMDSDYSGNKKNRGQDQQSIVKVLVSSRIAGILIGKGGETISSIKRDTDTFMLISKSNDLFPGTKDRVCMLNGTRDSVKKALDRMHQIVEDAINDEMNTNSIKFLITPDAGGLIIGKKGANIKEMKDKFSCNIKVHNVVENWNGVDERILLIEGEWNNVSLAIDVVLDKNSICPPSRDMDYENMSYCRGEEDNYGYNNYANNNGGGGGGSGGGRSYQSNGASAGGYGENSYESSGYGNQSRSRNDSYSSNVITCSGDNGDSSNNAYSGYGQNYYGDKGRNNGNSSRRSYNNGSPNSRRRN